MPSFDVVSEVDMHELANAVDQASREIGNRFDFKGVDASFALEGNLITIAAEQEFQLSQMLDVLRLKLAKRQIDTGSLDVGEPQVSGSTARQIINVRQGVDTELARKLVKMIKAAKLKVQAAIQGDKVRVTGKKRDDLQKVIALLKEADIDLPLQYDNFRD